MTTFLDIALACIRRGWFVFPCVPKDKVPVKGVSGYLDASNSEDQVRAWWAATPNANPAIAPGRSGFTVLDIDTGLTDEDSLRALLLAHNTPETFAVRTGRRPEYRVQLYFAGDASVIESFNGWEADGYAGDLRGCGSYGHVMAAGCIHPSGAAYEVLWNLPFAPVPNFVRALRPNKKEKVKADPTAPITEWRNEAMISLLGKHRQGGADDEAIEYLAHHINETRMKDNPLDGEELGRLIKNACGYPVGELEPVLVLGAPKAPEPPKDWREYFHTFDEMVNAPDPVFLIDGFLQKDSITAIAAPVGQRKSLIALNVAWALCTGQPLFDHFKVVEQPKRVLYLCPEMGLCSFNKRVRLIGLLPSVASGMLFCRTMSSEHAMTLDDLAPDALAGAVVIVDTAVRYLKGKEDASDDMRVFAESIFRLAKGCATVLLLHHSPKGTKDTGELTLENAMRGSGELGAFLYCCWATRLQDPSQPYASASYLSNVKQRDFESKPFEVTSGPDCRLHIVADPETVTVTLQSRTGGVKANKDGKDEAALILLKANVKLSNPKIVAALKDAGISRSVEWVRKRKLELLEANGGMMP